VAESSRTPQRAVLDALRRYVDAAVGVTEVPRDRAEKIVKDLAQRGEVRARDIQKAARELAERSARNRRELTGLIRKEIRRQVKGLGLATRDEVERLQRRVRELEKPTQRKPVSRKPSTSRKKQDGA
jgi:polyhydroxyalkanoate synthesis regulator phasin